MKFDPKIHPFDQAQGRHRRSIRLQGYDYSQAGAYYVTIVVWRREHIFGEIVGAGLKPTRTAEMQLNRFGQIVNDAWYDLPKHYPHVELDTFCIMPNHVHAIIVLNDYGMGESASGNMPIPNSSKTHPYVRHPLSEIVRAFKSFSARRINSLRNTQGIPVWQRNYYEHIIRNQEDYLSKSSYILDNPLNWDNDDENQR